METKGIIIEIMPKRSGVSGTGKPWVSQTFVIKEEGNLQYARHIAFELYGEQRIADASNVIAIGHKVAVSYDVESRKITPKTGDQYWMTSAKAWKVLDANATNANPAQPAQPSTAAMPDAVDETYDLFK